MFLTLKALSILVSFTQQETQYLEAELATDSATQILQASAVKIVKLEVMKQVCLYRVLDLYNELQVYPIDYSSTSLSSHEKLMPIC